MEASAGIPFFTDQNVPDSVGRYLMGCGHQVTRLRDVMLTTTADSIIAVACSQAGHVLVSHDKDFKEISKRLQITQRQYRKLLHRIHLRCQEPSDVVRLKEAMSLIEAEWQLIKPDRPMVIEINDVSIRITR